LLEGEPQAAGCSRVVAEETLRSLEDGGVGVGEVGTVGGEGVVCEYERLDTVMVEEGSLQMG